MSVKPENENENDPTKPAPNPTDNGNESVPSTETTRPRGAPPAPAGGRGKHGRLSRRQALRIRALWRSGASEDRIAEQEGVTRKTVGLAIKNIKRTQARKRAAVIKAAAAARRKAKAHVLMLRGHQSWKAARHISTATAADIGLLEQQHEERAAMRQAYLQGTPVRELAKWFKRSLRDVDELLGDTARRPEGHQPHRSQGSRKTKPGLETGTMRDEYRRRRYRQWRNHHGVVPNDCCVMEIRRDLTPDARHDMSNLVLVSKRTERWVRSEESAARQTGKDLPEQQRRNRIHRAALRVADRNLRWGTGITQKEQEPQAERDE